MTFEEFLKSEIKLAEEILKDWEVGTMEFEYAEGRKNTYEEILYNLQRNRNGVIVNLLNIYDICYKNKSCRTCPFHEVIQTKTKLIETCMFNAKPRDWKPYKIQEALRGTSGPKEVEK